MSLSRATPRPDNLTEKITQEQASRKELEAKVMTCQALREKMPDASDDEHANMLSRVVPDVARQIVERREKEL